MSFPYKDYEDFEKNRKRNPKYGPLYRYVNELSCNEAYAVGQHPIDNPGFWTDLYYQFFIGLDPITYDEV